MFSVFVYVMYGLYCYSLLRKLGVVLYVIVKVKKSSVSRSTNVLTQGFSVEITHRQYNLAQLRGTILICTSLKCYNINLF